MPHFRSLLLIAGFVAGLFCHPAPSLAWNSTGHMIIASQAYDQLSPEVRDKWVALLKEHPAFKAWSDTFPKDEPKLEFGRYLFMRASSWPDDIRRTGSPYEHSTWHYIDYPLETPDCPMEPAPANTEDILYALDRSQKTLNDEAASPVERAAALSWIMHLVGDIQQPLHCVTLINANYPKPDGDRGGNLFFISMAGVPINLHSVWDSLAGSMMDSQELIARARQLGERFPRIALPELAQATNPLGWSLEGRALAIEAVYRDGKLPGGKDANAPLPPLPSGYMSASRALADRRVALGGYRLADMLDQLAGAPSASPSRP